MADESDEESSGTFDIVALRQEERQFRVGLRGFPRLLLRAAGLVFKAARGPTLVSAGLAVISALLSVAQVGAAAIALRALLKAAGPNGHVGPVVLPMLLLAFLTGVSGITTLVTVQQQRLISELVQRRALGDLFDVTTRVPLEMFEHPRFFDQMQRIQTNAITRPTEVAQGLTNLLSGLLGAGAVAIALLKLAPVLLPVLILAGIPPVLLGRRGSRLEFAFAVAQATNFRRRFNLQEVLTSRPAAKEVRAFGTEGAIRGRWESEYAVYIAALRSQVTSRTWLAIASGVSTAILGGAALMLIVYLVVHNNLSLASAGAAIVAVRLLNSQVSSLASGFSSLYESALFLLDYEAFMRLHADQDLSESRPSMSSEFASGFTSLATEQLRFRYPSGTTDAIRGVNIEIHAGEVVALVGENGSGKTTLAKLLAGLYMPTGGRITWDGIDLSTVARSDIREGVAVIFQDFLMYALSASDNIGLGRPERLDDHRGIVGAARRSGADAFLRRMSSGYDTYLSSLFPGGRDLSVGQWQRVAIARAFFRSAPFVILDEPSSALDPRAEQDLFARIRTLLAKRTVLFVSHRFSTVRSADRIYVMKNGRVAEHGSHEDLMRQDGLYRELFTLQARGYESNSELSPGAASRASAAPRQTPRRPRARPRQ